MWFQLYDKREYGETHEAKAIGNVCSFIVRRGQSAARCHMLLLKPDIFRPPKSEPASSVRSEVTAAGPFEAEKLAVPIQLSGFNQKS